MSVIDTGSGNALPTAPAVVREQPGGESMRAIILEGFGGLDSLVYTDIPKPRPLDGEVVISVKGFGINHAEMHMRRGEWAEAAEVSGIECVGIVDSCPGREFLPPPSNRRSTDAIDGLGAGKALDKAGPDSNNGLCVPLSGRRGRTTDEFGTAARHRTVGVGIRRERDAARY